MKNIIKRIIVGTGIAFCIMFIKSCNVHAYVYLRTNNGTTSMQTNTSAIVNPSSGWPSSGYSYSVGTSDWIYDLGQYFNANLGSGGNELVIVADYYLGIQTNGTVLPTNYLNNTRNTLTANNLRCGIGSAYASGYDNTYSPTISNFNVSLVYDLSPNNYPQETYHVTYTYKQKLSSTKSGNSNVSCWFERNPSNGLFVQVSGSRVTNLYYGYTANLQYSLSGDPNTAALQTITSQNNTIINQNQTQINQNNQIIQEEKNTQTKIDNNTNAINNVNDTLTDDSVPDMGDYDFSSNNAQNGVINNLILMPINLIRAFNNGFNSSCSQFNLGSLYGTNLYLPCINPGDYLGNIWSVIDVIISGIFIYVFGKKCVKIFNDITNLKENQVDEVFD